MISPSIQTVAIFLLAALLAACQTAPPDAPHFSAAPKPPAGYGTLYLYRYEAPPYTGLIQFAVSGRRVFAAPDQAYTWIHVKAGEHTVFAQWPDQPGWKSPPVGNYFVPQGGSVYVRAEGAVNIQVLGLVAPGGMRLNTKLTLTPPERAEGELSACCRYVSPLVSVLE